MTTKTESGSARPCSRTLKCALGSQGEPNFVPWVEILRSTCTCEAGAAIPPQLDSRGTLP
jgi:hypothetical protein